MTRVIYGWRPGSRVNLDAQKAGEALASLEQASNGPLEPGMVVAAARDAASVLHPHFEWDDAKAADVHRTAQARELIRSLTVDISRSNLVETPVRAFVNVEAADRQGYVSTAVAMSQVDLRRQVVAKAWAELEAWRQRHAELVELARIFTIIDHGVPEARPPS